MACLFLICFCELDYTLSVAGQCFLFLNQAEAPIRNVILAVYVYLNYGKLAPKAIRRQRLGQHRLYSK